MPIESYDNNATIVRRYIDSTDVKSYVNEVLVPKYFKRIPISGLKVGEMGLISEYMSDIVEDGSYATSMALNESFITRAVLDESIYAAAATFDLGYEYAIPAAVPVVLQVHYEDIIKYAVDRQVYIDKDTKILLNDLEYVLDYDIRLTYTYIGGKIRFNAAYDMSTYNPVSKVVTPYIPCRTTNDWVVLYVTAREYKRTYQNQLITDNLMFTASPIELPFPDMICGLTGYYRYNDDLTLMTNKVKYSLPMNTPFFYHRLKTENSLEISFASGKKNWRPNFNSQIDFTLYTTHGDVGNFPISMDVESTVVRTGERFIYNEDIRMVAIPYNASVGGSDQPGIEMVRQDTIQAFNTAHVLMTDDDISLYFETYAKRYNTVAKFFKRRDDPTGRLFGMFNIINDNGYIYETITTKGMFKTGPESMIVENVNGNISENVRTITLYSGDMWRYYDWSEDDIDRRTIMTPLPYNFGKPHQILEEDKQKTFVSPFIMKINRYPGLVTYYNPLINYIGLMKQEYYENSVLDHFIVTKISIYRGIGENEYKVRVILVPSTQESTYNEFDPNRNFKYSYFSNPDDTYRFSFKEAGINMDNVNTNNGELQVLPDGTLNPKYKRSITEYMKDHFGIYPSNGNTVWNTDITKTDEKGFQGKYVYNTFREYIPITPDIFPLRVVLSAETTRETCYIEMVCIGEESGTYTFEANLKTKNDITIVQGREVVGLILGKDPYETKSIFGTTPTAPAGMSYVFTTNTKMHIYTIYKPANGDNITIDPATDKAFYFDKSSGVPPISQQVKLKPDVLDMRLNAIVEHIQSLDSSKQQGEFTPEFHIQNIDDKQFYKWRSTETPQWQPSTSTTDDDSFLFKFSFKNPPSLYNSDPIIFSKNISAAYACVPFPDGSLSTNIDDKATALNQNNGSTYQYVKSTERWLLLGSTSLFADPSFRGWNQTDSFLNDYDAFDLLEQWTQMRSTVIFNGSISKGYRVDVGLIPMLRYDVCEDPNKVSFVIRAMVEQYKQMAQLVSDRLEENTGIDFKLYNTCGRGVFYKIGVDSADNPQWTRLDSVSLRIKFILGVREEILYQDTMEAVKDHIKSYIENLDIDEATIFNISNLQTSIENTIDNVRYLIFLGINDYDSTYQRIKMDDPYKVDMSTIEQMLYVPEMLTINRKNIDIIRGE